MSDDAILDMIFNPNLDLPLEAFEPEKTKGETIGQTAASPSAWHTHIGDTT